MYHTLQPSLFCQCHERRAVGNYGLSLIPFSTTTTMDISEIKRSCFSNSSVSSRSKDNSLDLEDTKNYKPSTTKKFKESCSLPAGDAIAPASIAAPTYSTDSKLPLKKIMKPRLSIVIRQKRSKKEMTYIPIFI